MLDVFVSGTRWGAFTVAHYEVPALVDAFICFYVEQVKQPDKWGQVIAHVPGKDLHNSKVVLSYENQKKHYRLATLVTSADSVVQSKGIGILRYQTPPLLLPTHCGYAVFQSNKLVSVCTLSLVLVKEKEVTVQRCPKHKEKYGCYEEQ